MHDIKNVEENLPFVIRAVVGTNCDNKNHENSGGVSEKDLNEFIKETGIVPYKVNTKKVETLYYFFIEIIEIALEVEDERNARNKEVRKMEKDAVTVLFIKNNMCYYVMVLIISKISKKLKIIN